MNIRFATLEDVPTFVEMGKQFHQSTRFRVVELAKMDANRGEIIR